MHCLHCAPLLGLLSATFECHPVGPYCQLLLCYTVLIIIRYIIRCLRYAACCAIDTLGWSF